ncbi:hypothetical protein DFJ74DRAFT_668860 [Hyaloraphidium curvatum]|nr:hypothetical protein DFJ74DRAFT_668860 [Hyaloraphidium curvatum]
MTISNGVGVAGGPSTCGGNRNGIARGSAGNPGTVRGGSESQLSIVVESSLRAEARWPCKSCCGATMGRLCIWCCAAPPGPCCSRNGDDGAEESARKPPSAAKHSAGAAARSVASWSGLSVKNFCRPRAPSLGEADSVLLTACSDRGCSDFFRDARGFTAFSFLFGLSFSGFFLHEVRKCFTSSATVTTNFPQSKHFRWRFPNCRLHQLMKRSRSR